MVIRIHRIHTNDALNLNKGHFNIKIKDVLCSGSTLVVICHRSLLGLTYKNEFEK